MKDNEVTKSQTFAAIIQKVNGQNTLKLKSSNYFKAMLAKFKIGELITLTVSNQRLKRSLAQNAYYWGVYLPMIAEAAGQPVEYLHEYFKGKFLTKQIVEVYGEKVRIRGSTADMSIGEFSQYIMDIQEFTGIEAPPTENYDLEPINKNNKK